MAERGNYGLFVLLRMSAGEGLSAADTRARTMSSGSVIFHNPAGLFPTTGMQEYPVRHDLKWQIPIYSRFAPLLPSARPPFFSRFRFLNATLSLRHQMGKIPPVSVGKSQHLKQFTDLNIESHARIRD